MTESKGEREREREIHLEVLKEMAADVTLVHKFEGFSVTYHSWRCRVASRGKNIVKLCHGHFNEKCILVWFENIGLSKSSQPRSISIYRNVMNDTSHIPYSTHKVLCLANETQFCMEV